MSACIGQIRMQGLVKIAEDGSWAEDRQNPLYFLVHVAKVALPLYPQFGTQPNGYYIPPRWVARSFRRCAVIRVGPPPIKSSRIFATGCCATGSR